MKLTGAEIFVECLKKEGVKTIFALPGGVVLKIFDVLHQQKDVEVILTRHEQGAGHMAEGYAKATGKPGVALVTPLRLADGSAVLVDRGWVPSPDAYTVRLDSVREPDTAQVAGMLLRVTASREFALPDSTWPVHVPSDDPARLADRYPYPLLPWVLRRTEADGPVPPRLRPIPLPVIDNGPHLSYAIQWFAFATIAVVGSVLLFVRERETGKGKRET